MVSRVSCLCGLQGVMVDTIILYAGWSCVVHTSLVTLHWGGGGGTMGRGRGRRYNGEGEGEEVQWFRIEHWATALMQGNCVHIMSLESFHLKHNPL